MPNVELLTGSNWETSYRWLADQAEESLLMAHWSVSTKWPERTRSARTVWTALLEAPQRGVDCWLLLYQHKRHAVTRAFNYWSAQALSKAGWNVVVTGPAEPLHCKVLVVDERWTIIGSHNLTWNAAAVNRETSILIDSPPFSRQVIRQLQKWGLHRPLSVDLAKPQFPPPGPLDNCPHADCASQESIVVDFDPAQRRLLLGDR